MLNVLFTSDRFGRTITKLLGCKGPQVRGSYHWVPGNDHYLIDFEKAIASVPTWGKILFLIIGVLVIVTLIIAINKIFFQKPQRPLANRNA